MPPEFDGALRRADRTARDARAGRVHRRPARVLGPRVRGHARRADPAPRDRIHRRSSAASLRATATPCDRIVDVGTGSGCLAVVAGAANFRRRGSSPPTSRPRRWRSRAGNAGVMASTARIAFRPWRPARRVGGRARCHRRQPSVRPGGDVARCRPKCATTSRRSRCTAATTGSTSISGSCSPRARACGRTAGLSMEFGYGQDDAVRAMARVAGWTGRRSRPQMTTCRASRASP